MEETMDEDDDLDNIENTFSSNYAFNIGILLRLINIL